MEFKGKQGKLRVEEIKEDYYVHLINDKGNSVASISTIEGQYNEALMYAKLFSKAPEMLEMLVRIMNTYDKGTQTYIDCQQLIKEATEL